MMQVIDGKRFDAFVQLLAQPDPADLPRRGHVLRCEGDPDRRSTRLPRILMGWLQQRHLNVDLEEPLAPAVAGVAPAIRPRMHLLRPTGTDGR